MLISIVIPLLNERHTLVELHRRLVAMGQRTGCDLDIIFVDDGSTDGSDEVIRGIAALDPAVRALRFSRNFGHEAASTAGLDIAGGDVTVLMDADLQDPPELIDEMLEFWKQDYQVVYAVRRRRAGESALKLTAAWAFYRALNLLADVRIPVDTGDFRLMDARVVRALRQCRENHRFVRGLVAWMGFRSAAVEYDRAARAAGQTHYGLFKLLLLSLDAFVGFSLSPLRLAWVGGMMLTAIGSVVMLAGLAAGLMQGRFWSMLAFGEIGLFFVAGVQLLCVGIVGEYIGRIFRQAQNRPLYLVTEEIVTPRVATAALHDRTLAA
jgi:dolichol-phosphate mannosyltransferase